MKRRADLLLLIVLLASLCACMAAPAGYFDHGEADEPAPMEPEMVAALFEVALKTGDAEAAAALYAEGGAEMMAALDALLVADADARIADVRGGAAVEPALEWLVAVRDTAGVELDAHINKLKQAQGSRIAYEETLAYYEAGAYLEALDCASHVLYGWGQDEAVEALVERTSDALSTQMAEEALRMREEGEYERAMYRALDAYYFFENDASLAAMEACTAPPPSYLGAVTRADYRYEIEWEPYVFDEDRPLEYLKVQVLPEGERKRMEGIIERFAMLYPPDYFNNRVERILCYKTFAAARLDDDDQAVLNAKGGLIFDSFVGATGEGHIIITPNFDSDAEILKALVHEFGHVQFHFSNGDDSHKDAYAAALVRINGSGFTYYYDNEGIERTSDIAGWRSTDSTSDWKQGFARRYGMLSMDEDHSTLMEKIQLGRMPDYADYPALYEKMAETVKLMGEEHPAFTMEFFTEALPEYWGR